MLFKPKITVTPVLGKDLIGHETRDAHGNVMRQVANLQDQIVRKQLIDAGWTPPREAAAEIGKAMQQEHRRTTP